MTHEPSPAVMPGIVKAAVVVTFFNTWVLFEETFQLRGSNDSR